ncbi:hypothetical protein AB5N19_08491 [Seiridium cardinale]|uniref:Uncharacterized protein n=1 Tax=Seiridium cardinale TaxID=138064 RepID=A0ABR2XUX7_9PEZI
MAHPYVHHALLTFSALHIASLSRANTHSSTISPDLVTALSHKSTAIETLRPAVDRVDSQTCEPALAASGLLTCCAFALPLVGAPFDPIDLLAQIVSLFQGSTALFRMGWRDPGALDKTTSLMVRRSVVIASANEAPWPEAEQAVDHLIHAIAMLDCPNQGKKEVLMDSALKSKVALRRVAAAPGVYTVATMWLGMVWPAFITYIQERDPLALILLAYWAVCLKGVSHVWWTRGWAERTLQAVWQIIGEEHVHLLVWPATEVGVVL